MSNQKRTKYKRKKKRISVQAGKAKGRRLQQWVAEKISKLLGFSYGPDELIASREMGQSGVDIRLVGPALKLFPWSVECKSQESWSVHSWIKQAKENQMEGTEWLLVCKKSFKDPVVILDADVFFQLLTLKRGIKGLKK